MTPRQYTGQPTHSELMAAQYGEAPTWS